MIWEHGRAGGIPDRPPRSGSWQRIELRGHCFGHCSAVLIFAVCEDTRSSLQEGWVIANHILVSFHVAFISSVLALPAAATFKTDVLRFIFTSWETLVSAVFMYISFHVGIALHELGHFLTAVRLNALNESVATDVSPKLAQPFFPRLLFLARMFLRIPFGTAPGVNREGLNYYPDAPYNLAVAAAGPRTSRNVAVTTLPIAVALLTAGLALDLSAAIYAGRLFLGIGLVSFLDFRFADRGKYAEFRSRERTARDKARSKAGVSGWLERCPEIKRRMVRDRIQDAIHPQLGPITAPWQFRNCGMGGRHTEKEYPESNISMQEAMFLILDAKDYQDAQELTVRLQNRLKEIIEKEEGCRVMGIGLEGGLAPYVEKAGYPLPEVRLWSMMKTAIAECGCQPGVDVAIALDPAMNELEIAYRDEFDMPDSVGMYLFWRDKAKVVLDRNAVLDIYVKAIEEHEIPLLSIEDGFSEDDHEGWGLLLERLGDSVFVIGDDLVTTNDQTIEIASRKGLINSALIKANQIGSLYETLLAMLVAMGKGMDLVVSHRSKSPNDDMEAQIALSVNSLGLKAGGGANTERLVKYQAVTELMLKVTESDAQHSLREGEKAVVRKVRAYEEPTNAGIPTVGVTLDLSVPSAGVLLKFKGATPLGTSAGTGEAIHLVDALIEQAEHREIIERFPDFFDEQEPGVFSFSKRITEARVRSAHDEGLAALFERSQRYGGKGCLNAVDNVLQIIAPYFEGVDLAAFGLKDIDAALLGLELATARRRGKIAHPSADDDLIGVMQRKQNLGMNALLSVSLALARAVAHVQGKELYELLREEMLEIVDDLTAEFEVEVEGSRFIDYVAALKQVNRILEDRDTRLFEVLRERTAIYDAAKDLSVGPVSARSETERAVAVPPKTEPDAGAAHGPPETPEPFSHLAATGMEVAPPEGFSSDEQERVRALNRELYRAYVDQESDIDIKGILSSYQQMRTDLKHTVGRFGIVNNRIFQHNGCLRIPYLLDGTLLLYAVCSDANELESARRFPDGTIFTDTVFDELADATGTPIDLEQMLFAFDVGRVVEPRIARIRDITSLLKEVNEASNRNEALHLLRHLVARLCNLSPKTFLGAKNLQPEVNKLNEELLRFINGWLCESLPGLTRTVVRNLSSVIGKPNLIDQLWNDTIRLAEVEVRGSAIVNELRRSSHHALGQRTLQLAQAYLDFLDHGETGELARLGFASPSEADLEAARGDTPRRIVARVVEDLGRLLGTSETVARIEEWQQSYEEALVQCQFGNPIDNELETLISKGIRARNRWVYYHHLRILAQKADDFSWPTDVVSSFESCLDGLQTLRPSDEGFDTDAAEGRAREGVEAFVGGIRAAYQDGLFTSLRSVLDANENGSPFDTFTRVRDLRVKLQDMIRVGGFTAQRYFLQQLDCLLEEMNYLALRRIATTYAEGTVDLEQCLEIIRLSILNLEFEGLASHELYDLAGLLCNPARTEGELLDVLRYISRHYHKIRQRVTVPYEKMIHHLKLDEEDLRTVLANMQRYMHDLNSVVHFSDIAGAFIRERQIRGAELGAHDTPEGHPNPHTILHISHRDEVANAMKICGDRANLRERYGGKGSCLLYFSHLGLPTRDGFILPASVPRARLHRTDPGWLSREIDDHLHILEDDLAKRGSARKRYGDENRPLVLAVRGGSVFSMPGMLSTVVFVGMNDRIVEALAVDGPWRAYDSYRRFLASFGVAMWGVDLETFNLVDDAKRRYGVEYKTDLPWEAMREVAEASKTVFRDHGFSIELDSALADPMKQLRNAVTAVFESWNMERAERYRNIKGISHSWQTAVIVQEMAFGNGRNEPIQPSMDESLVSLTGVIPRTNVNDFGIRELSGEFKFSAAGDDLVGGVTSSGSFHSIGELDTLLPMLGRRLRHIGDRLRRFTGTDQEVEFTVESGVLSVLQSRTAETYADEATDRFVEPGEPITRGLGVRGGGFRGLVAFDEVDLEELAATDFSARDDVDGVLMVLENPTPEDIPMVISADGLLTAKGGSTSHAAVAANGIEDKSFSAVMSATGLQVDFEKREATIVDPDGIVRHRIHTGDVVSVHGTSGEVYIGSRALARNGPGEDGRDAPATPLSRPS